MANKTKATKRIINMVEGFDEEETSSEVSTTTSSISAGPALI